MANQPTKYRKFIVGAASAALVASAVAPVASAKDFKDTKGNTHEAAIDALSDAGIITGYEDGTFKPNKTLTRSDVVKMMGKWLVSLGHEVPEDYKTNPRFADQTAKTNDELLKYSALVKDHGVFNGYENGSLGATEDITRENMAIVLVRAYDSINDTDLVAFVAEQEFKKDVTDRATAKAEARPYIDVLDFFDITNPAAPQFNPKATTTRGQFASFLDKTSKVETEAPEEEVVTATKVESVSATNLKEIVVAFDGTVDKASAENLGSYNLKLDTSNVALKSARLQEDGKTVVLTLDATPLDNQEEYTLTVTNVKSSDKKVNVSAKDFAFTPVDAALPTVVSVEGLGNKAIKVTFSEPVKVNSTVAGTFKLDDKVVSGILSGNGTRTVIIELFNTMTTGKHTLAINNQVEDFAGYDLVATSVEFDVVEDVTAPTVVEVKDVTLESATVVFSEDVKDAEALKGSNYYWMNGSTKHAADATVEKIDGKTFKLTFSGNNKLPAVAIDLYVTNVVDYSGNKIAADTKVTISPVIDQTRPEVVSAVFADTNDKLTLTFNKNINPSTFKATNVVLKDEDGKVVTGYGYTVSESGSSSRTLTVNFSEALDPGTYTFELTGIQDTTTLKNTALPIVETLEVANVSKPKVTSVTGDKNVYFVNFNAAMDISSDASVLNPENYYVKYVQSGVTRTGKLPASTNITPINGNRGVIITLPASVSSLEEITIQGVKGANGVYLDGFSVKYGDSTNPIVNTFDIDRVNATAKDTLLVKFNQPVASVDRLLLSVGSLTVTDAEIQADNTVVKLTLSGKLDTDATGATLTYSANAFKSLSDRTVTGTSETVLDSIAPEVKKDSDGKITVATTGTSTTPGIFVDAANEKITINFQEAVKAKNIADVRDNFKLYLPNGLALEYGVDFKIDSTTATDLVRTAGTSSIVLDLSDATYDGALNVQFDNTNANIVDADAYKTNGTANTALAAAGFDTRTSGSTTGTINTGVAPTITTAVYNAGGTGSPAQPEVKATANVDFGTDASGDTDALKLTSKLTGTSGNGLVVKFVNAIDNAATTVNVVGGELVVELADDGSAGTPGAITATTAQVVTAINAATGANSVVSAALVGDGSATAATATATTAGGINAAPEVPAGTTTLVLTFSEAMNIASLDAANEIVIKNSGGTAVRSLGTNPTFVWNTAKTILTITPGASHDVVSGDVITSTTAKDASGNAVDLTNSADKVLN
ncbi:S-layer homology domain-containing protein [Sporosarcina oncorhynchi]|uniref:S-layer homology domain-containing protein n=1 Tax=Sporosarcina oncorhynchi TaxID=3056444 RepID=A0ABZ0L652_9BACL|nr:S-layer homology domain-containing protein [Sporosarcina sp. T2O-4]WOV88041.1 S-layer homology domain-containing protein [Sporosarcina sp. T2O-4]